MSEDLTGVAREDLDAFNSGDWDRMRDCLTPDSVYEEPATGRRLEGHDAIIEANEGWKAAFPDAKGTITDAFECGDRVAIQITWDAVHSGPLQLPGGSEVPPTNRSISVQACQVMRFEDGKIAEARHFFDMLGMLEQMGTISAEALAQA